MRRITSSWPLSTTFFSKTITISYEKWFTRNFLDAFRTDWGRTDHQIHKSSFSGSEDISDPVGNTAWPCSANREPRRLFGRKSFSSFRTEICKNGKNSITLVALSHSMLRYFTAIHSKKLSLFRTFDWRVLQFWPMLSGLVSQISEIQKDQISWSRKFAFSYDIFIFSVPQFQCQMENFLKIFSCINEIWNLRVQGQCPSYHH